MRQILIPVGVLGLLLAVGPAAPFAAPASRGQAPCEQITAACLRAGFAPGAAHAGSGLQLDCVDPIMQGTGQPPRARLALPQINPKIVEQCKASNPAFRQGKAPPSEPAAQAQPANTVPPAAAVRNAPLRAENAAPTITYIGGSTTKVNQIVGETDKEFHKPTLSLTETRYGLKGVDLGYSFEHQGRTYFLFGDTVGVEGHALDSIATTDATDPDLGVRLDFLSPRRGDYTTIQPPGIKMGVDEVPVSGISLNGQMYVVVTTNHSDDRSTDRSVLTRASFPVTPTGFRPLRTISQRPAGKFIKMSLHLQPGAIPGLPPGGPFVLIWGTGWYRHSDAFLSIVPAASFETGAGTLYFGGLDATAAPVWRPREADAQSIVTDGRMGDLSVTWCEALGLWLMTFDSHPPATTGVLFSYSASPWGPWSAPQVIFDLQRDGALGRFIHVKDSGDGLAGPVIGKEASQNPEGVQGGQYAPYVVERWTKVAGSELDLYYVLSTWNPYVVVLMESRMQIDRASTPHPVPPPDPRVNCGLRCQ